MNQMNEELKQKLVKNHEKWETADKQQGNCMVTAPKPHLNNKLKQLWIEAKTTQKSWKIIENEKQQGNCMVTASGLQD